jgi:formate hydrogenlyase transcriptional activator
MHAAFQPDRGEPLPSAGYDALRRVSRAIAAHHDIKNLLRSLADELRPVVNFVFLRVFLYDQEPHLMRLHVSEAPGPPPEPFSEFPPEGTAVGWVYERQEPLVIPDVDKETRFPRLHGILKEYGIRSHLTFPLTTAHGRLGTFAVGSDQVDAYSGEDVRFSRWFPIRSRSLLTMRLPKARLPISRTNSRKKSFTWNQKFVAR